MDKKVLVDMSMTLIHHGHIRLLEKASRLGKVILALTTDEEIKKFKGYDPELSYENRKEIANSIIYISEVIPSPWLIDQEFFEKTNADYLVHGSDNTNNIDKEKLIIFERTEGISSTILRKRVINTVVNKAFG